MDKAAVRSKAVVLLLIDTPNVCVDFVFGPSFVIKYFMS